MTWIPISDENLTLLRGELESQARVGYRECVDWDDVVGLVARLDLAERKLEGKNDDPNQGTPGDSLLSPLSDPGPALARGDLLPDRSPGRVTPDVKGVNRPANWAEHVAIQLSYELDLDETLSRPLHDVCLREIEKALLEARAAGLDKAADLCRYHRDLPNRNEAWKGACRDIETSCLAAAGRIRRGEYENPTSSVG